MTEVAATLLIVDDEPQNREILTDLLARDGYTLLEAADGEEALALAAAHRPDLVLLDIMMPKLDGLAVCRALRADPDLAEIPIVLVTALDDRATRLAGLSAGADDFLTKPVDRSEVTARVRTITRLNRYRKLCAERTRFAWMVEQAADGYLLLDEAGAVIFANARARLLLGADGASGPLPSKSFLEWIGREYRCEPEEAWASWPAPDPAGQRRLLVRPESETAPAGWLRVESLTLPAGSGAGSMVCLRDVTAEMAARRESRTFQSLISHKLYTPMTLVLGGLQLLASQWEQVPPKKVQELLRACLAGADRLRGQIDDVLAYVGAPTMAEPGAGCRVGDLPAVVEAAAAALSMRAPALWLGEGLGDTRLRLGPRAVDGILRELLENSQKFHPRRDPTVTVRASSAADGRVALCVQDDGIALSPEQRRMAWDPFYQGEKYFTGQTPGMGLGLALVANLVWGVGGSCRLSNRADGPGVAVELSIPCAGEEGVRDV